MDSTIPYCHRPCSSTQQRPHDVMSPVVYDRMCQLRPVFLHW